MKKLLVLTSLEDTWGTSEDIVFLGEWCTLYERTSIWKQRNYEILPFHWDDRNKLLADYDYLEKLHHALLIALADMLNQYHQVNHTTRYWQMLIDPWLMAYVGVLFDRWEHIRLAFEKYPLVSCIFYQSSTAPCFSYNEFITDACSDQWNQSLYEEIIKFQQKTAPLQEECSAQKNRTDAPISPPIISNCKRLFFYDQLLNLLGIFFRNSSNAYRVVFLNSYFNVKTLLKFNIYLKQIPRLFRKNFYDYNLQRMSYSFHPSISNRTNLQITLQPSNAFEKFLLERMIIDLPTSLLEHYQPILQTINKEKFLGKLICTGGDHWGNIFAKFLFSQNINNDCKLAILEHGGSLPAYKELFNFEEDISDFKTTWFSPYHHKHIQMPPPKLIHRFPKNLLIKKLAYRGKYLSIIGNECSRWVFRCHFYPMSTQCLVSFDLIIQLFANLHTDIQQFFKIKPYPNQGINTKQRFEDSLGKQHIYAERRLDKVFYQSKIIICTYPETTFSEAMATGIPTIILFPSHLYERHPSAQSLLKQLYKSKIAFNNPLAAAQHINAIWNDPLDWWESSLVKNTRTFFYQMALAKVDDNPIQAWIQLFQKHLI